MARPVVFALFVVLLAGHSAEARVPVKRALDAARPLPAAAVAAAAATSTDKRVQRMVQPLGCDRLSVAEGLPNSNVHAIVQDRSGFIWFGTQEGLVRYDGTTMRVYRPVDKDPASISAGFVPALALDASGKLWVGTAERGVNLYDPATDHFTRFMREPGKSPLSSEGVTSILRDRKDRMWFAMSGGGLNRFDAATGAFTSYLTKPLDAAVTAMDSDASGNLWLGTASEGVIRFNPDGGTSAIRPTPGDDRGLGGAPITAIPASPGGKVWIGTDGEGVVALDPASGKLTHHRAVADDASTLTDDHITALFEDRNKNLWVGTTNGLNRVDPSGHIVQYLHDRNDPTSLSFNGVEAVYQDRGGVMWIGGLTVGVCKFDEFRLKFGQHHTGNLATSFFEDPDGTLWVGTYNDGLHKH